MFSIFIEEEIYPFVALVVIELQSAHKIVAMAIFGSYTTTFDMHGLSIELAPRSISSEMKRTPRAMVLTV